MVAQRTILQTATTFLVDNDNGDDSNDGLTSPKKTIQAMMNTIFMEYDHGGHPLAIQLADSAMPYDGFSIRGSHAGHYGNPSIISPPTWQLQGNASDPTKTHIHGNGVPAVESVVGKSLHLEHLYLTSDVSAVNAYLTGTEVCLHTVIIGSCRASALYVGGGANLLFEADCQIVGGAPQFLYADQLGMVTASTAFKFIFSGACSFGDFFIGAARNASINMASMTGFILNSGASASGQRWAVARGGQIDTGGRNPETLFPGSVAGGVRIGGGFCG